MNSHKMEDKDSPELQEKLKKLGFQRTQFEPKVGNRFIAHVNGIPSYVIKGVSLPDWFPGGEPIWSQITLELYNPLGGKIEQAVLKLTEEPFALKIQVLDPTGEVDTTWDITCRVAKIAFGSINWSDEGEPHLIYVTCNVDSANITYPV